MRQGRRKMNGKLLTFSYEYMNKNLTESDFTISSSIFRRQFQSTHYRSYNINMNFMFISTKSLSSGNRISKHIRSIFSSTNIAYFLLLLLHLFLAMPDFFFSLSLVFFFFFFYYEHTKASVRNDGSSLLLFLFFNDNDDSKSNSFFFVAFALISSGILNSIYNGASPLELLLVSSPFLSTTRSKYMRC